MDLTRFADEYWRAKDDRVDQERLGLLLEEIPAHSRVLVVDGGPGMLPARIRDEGFDVTMTDLSSHAVERARAKGLEAHQVDTDDHSLPFPDGTFDCVLSDSAIEHRYWPARAVSECARVLRPGGTFVLLVPNVAHWRYRLLLLFGRFPPIEGAASDWCHLRMLALPEARALVRDAGLHLTRVRGFPSLWVKGLYPSLFRAPGIRSLYRLLCRLRPTLFGRDLILVCRRPRA
jgi:SAM-dependent methyltransferase